MSVAFRPDGRALLTASMDRSARQWDVATGAPLSVPRHHRSPDARAAYSPDGLLIATAGSDRFAHFWDAATGKPVGPPLRHAHFDGDIAFHSKGPLLLTRGWDCTIRVWDVPRIAVAERAFYLLWAEVFTGMELGRDGSAHELNEGAWRWRRARLARLGGGLVLPGFLTRHRLDPEFYWRLTLSERLGRVTFRRSASAMRPRLRSEPPPCPQPTRRTRRYTGLSRAGPTS